MLVMAIDQCRHRHAADHIDASSDQGKSLAGEINDLRCLGNASVEPRLDGVAVGRADVSRLRRHQGAQVISNDHLGGFCLQGAHCQPGRAARHCGNEYARGCQHAPGWPRTRSPQPDRGFDPAPELRRCSLVRQPISDQVAQCLRAVTLGRQRRIGRERALELERMRRIELSIEIAVHEQAVVGVGRGRNHGSSVLSVVIRRRRARASRDMTVPIGTPVTSAISR